MRILVIEDSAETADYVAKGLREEGHVVDVAENGIDGLHLATTTSPDLLIVDRMLPRLDGVAVVKALRANGSRAPVLFLTAMGAVEERVEGFAAGGDDYLIKPFSFAELKARVGALLRRPPLQDELVALQVGDLRVDRLKREVTRGGAVVELQPREYQLLEFLMSHAGRVVTRTMLLEGVWDLHFDPSTNIVETHMSRLRAKIDKGDGVSLIRTVRGAGYMIDAD
jgi:two-component system OmpR family response regulator